MMRSGHHAIMQWLCNIMGGNIGFVNNCYTIPWDRSWDNVIFNREDKPLLTSLRKLSNLSATCPCSYTITDILILRSPRNLFASRLKHSMALVAKRVANPQCIESMTRKSIPLWKEYAREFINNQIPGLIKISYDMWFQYPQYRISIAKQLNAQYLDASIKHIPSYGDGSSFDGMTYDGQAHKMDVLNRHKSYQSSEFFQSLFDSEVDMLATQVENLLLTDLGPIASPGQSDPSLE